MLYTNPAQLPDHYHAVYLSPHFDDAALSCGGAIAQQAAQGVLIISICTATPPATLSAFAAHLHQRWGDTEQPILTRRQEDAAAAALLGADLLWLDAADAIYRHPAYDSVAAIFAAPVADDPLLPALNTQLLALHDHLPRATWYAPLAIGNHVDHQLVFAAAQTLAQHGAALCFYEDLPYAAQPAAVSARLDALGPSFSARTVDVSASLAHKLDAIAAYRSQMVELFGDEATMRTVITRYAARIAPTGATAGERLWLREQALNGRS